jgi:undecaprenyl-diphosphatase
MATFLEQINDLILHLEHWGYLIVFLIVVLECQAFLGLFMPGESMVLFAGFLAAQDVFDVRVVVGVVALGAIIGDSIGYEFGRWLGRDWLRRHGPSFWLRLERLDRMDAFFARYGGLAVFFAHFLHVGRALMPFLAGASHLPYLRFLLYNGIGCILWATVFTLLGYVFGQSWYLIDRLVGRAGIIAAIALGIIVAMIFLWRLVVNREMEIRNWWTRFCAQPRVIKLRTHFANEIDWLENRLSPEGYLGIHLTVGVILLLAAAAIIGGTMESLGARAFFVASDSQVAEWFASHATEPMSALMQRIAQLGSLAWLGCLVAMAALVWRHERHLLRLLLLAGPGGVILDFLLKHFFAHVRPHSTAINPHSLNFFEGDVMAATVVYGSIAYVLLRTLHRWRSGGLAIVSSVLLVFLIALSRVYLEAVQLSEALVALFEGAIWLLFCISGVEIVRWREIAHRFPLREMEVK